VIPKSAESENLEAFFSLRQFSFNPSVEAGTKLYRGGWMQWYVSRLTTLFHGSRLVSPRCIARLRYDIWRYGFCF
jgi:hypothetical protein